MKNCKECIHNDFCNVDGYIKADDCKFYKNKADVVEVVRCKDCQHYKAQKQSAHWDNAKKYCCRSATVKMNEFDYCSKGERRTDNE